jgi:PAS domain S-box-containing protein
VAAGVTRSTDETFRRAFDAAPDGMLVVDDEGLVVLANPKALELFGYGGDELVGQSVDLLVPEPLRGVHVQHRRDYMTRPHSRPMGSGLDLRGTRKSGEEFPVEISLSPVETQGRRHVIAIIRDVSERRHVSDALMTAREELALADDRERIARDLHDTVIQRLFAVGLSLQGALVRSDDEPTKARIELAIDEIDATIRDIRTAIFSLHTRRTPLSGVRDDILNVIREAARALGFEPQVVFDGLVDSAISEGVREHLVPTVREALSNTARHSHATRVSVTVFVNADHVLLRVDDNGIGVPDDIPARSGVTNMIDRAVALGGRCSVQRGASGGTAVEWQVPLGDPGR